MALLIHTVVTQPQKEKAEKAVNEDEATEQRKVAKEEEDQEKEEEEYVEMMEEASATTLPGLTVLLFCIKFVLYLLNYGCRALLVTRTARWLLRLHPPVPFQRCPRPVYRVIAILCLIFTSM
jgi:hypothetical protein